MDEDKLKKAFSKVKGDIFTLGKEIGALKLLISDMKNEIKILTQAFKDSQNNEKTPEISKKETPTDSQESPTNQQINPTDKDNPTDNLLSQVLKGQNKIVSTGNEGVPTDRQTNQQTDRHMIQHINFPQKQEISVKLDHLQKAEEILASLDALKKELRIKIKRLTQKEMQVFSFVYSLEQQGEIVDYPLLSSKLNLSESSIRDYIGKIGKKGIPITKEKLNNKKIILHIPLELKKIASLDTIIKLREI